MGQREVLRGGDCPPLLQMGQCAQPQCSAELPWGWGCFCCREADVHNLPADPAAPACTDAALLGDKGTVTPWHGVMRVHNLRGFLQLW